MQFPDKTGRTALHLACEHHQWVVVYVLLKEGARVNVVDADGSTPLHIAASRGDPVIVHLILQHTDTGIFDEVGHNH